MYGISYPNRFRHFITAYLLSDYLLDSSLGEEILPDHHYEVCGHIHQWWCIGEIFCQDNAGYHLCHLKKRKHATFQIISNNTYYC